MRYQGRLTEWQDDKGFGVIAPSDGSRRVFVHISAFRNPLRRPVGGELVTYECITDGDGRRQARAVSFAGDNAFSAAPGASKVPIVFALGFVSALAFGVISGRLPVLVALVYLTASAVAFIAYAHDKSAALRGKWRTKESTLHILALVGGWPGALAAQRLLRHKSAKTSFQSMFWMTVFLNCGAFAWLFSTSGQQFIRTLAG
ncbi:DUF1294 domain-containing protein [Uliginosibacterium sp. sgz301328]|uniref:DUF1294 domain-containing protein n=1 Tax=Uliginosibacterium sp. sgz301328 TaxID=3243764 RepID=UPI00359DB820